MLLDIIFNKYDKIYNVEDVVEGKVVLENKSDVRHDGITLTLEGVLNFSTSGKGGGLIDSFINSSKLQTIFSHNVEIRKSGKIPPGKLELPFCIPLKPVKNQKLYETYLGVNLFVRYSLVCEVKGNLLTKGMTKSQEIFLECMEVDSVNVNKSRITFQITPETMMNMQERRRIPRFLVSGYLDSSVCLISKPISGELIIEECQSGALITSIELQLLRVETIGSGDSSITNVSEIQSIQICDGMACPGIAIPIYMVLPRIFTCSTVVSSNFKIEFALNIMVAFENGHQIVETIPITLIRGQK